MKFTLPSATPDHWNNLLWALQAPDIAASFSLPWLSASRRTALYQYFSTPDIRSRLAPQLIERLGQVTSRRLGIYFENLWSFAFSHHPHYQLVLQNFPIRDQGKTLGELDFVVHHLPDDSLEHWELALKFYLRVDNFWVGPGLKDRLDIKLERMRDHQLPVAHSPIATDTLQRAGVKLDRQWALMPGRLFEPLIDMTDLGAPTPATPANFWWASLTQFLSQAPGVCGASGTHWIHLPKTCWLSSLAGHQPDNACTPITGESELKARLEERGPLCVALLGQQGEIGRGFVVPDDWHRRANQSLPH